ncbi:MAG: glycosyltransferase [Candidatus Omnitrophica bacterium]|nr:glycosyltransferase [Candidatus Omnitrophota bacterium]
MKVLQIFDQTTPLVSGYSMRSRYISESLSRLGVDLLAFSSPNFSYKQNDELINGVRYIRTNYKQNNIFNKLPILKEYKTVATLKNAIAKAWDNNVGLIDAHSSPLNGVVGAQLAKQYRLPFLYEIRALWEDAAVDQGKTKEGDLRYLATRWLETSIINKANKVTVICEGLKNDLIGRGVPASKIDVIPNGVNSDEFQPLEKDHNLAKELNLEGCIVFGYIGTFFVFEGLDLLIRAAKTATSRNKDLRFLIVGGGYHEATLKKMAKDLGVEDKVIFVGRVKHEDIKRYYSIIDAFVYPRISKRITELVTPLKPLESMAMEKIVLGSNVGGIKELVTDNFNGFLFEKENVDDLVDKIAYISSHLSSLDAMRRTARKYVVEERNWLTICQKYLSIYKELGVTV